MSISVDEIKKLKDLTGVGLTDAKSALIEAEGDFDKALEAMRKKGLTKAEKRGEREALQGLVDAYVHSDRIGAMVEVNCETDFVARTDDFKTLVHDIAMHVSATNPMYISTEDVPTDVYDAKKSELIEEAKASGKPAEIAEKIVEGQVKKNFEQGFEKRLEEIRNAALERSLRQERLDVTLPGRRPVRGRLHPATQTLREITRVFSEMGFQVYRATDV